MRARYFYQNLPRRLALAAAATLLTLSSTGCGNWMKSGVHMADPGTYKSSGTSYTGGNGGYGSDTNFDCTQIQESYTYSGADAYRICVNKTDSFTLSFHGYPSRNKSQVCIFPVDILSESQLVWSADSSGNILYQCLDMSTGYNTHSFTGARFNGAFVVSAADAQSMGSCLLQGKYDQCPAFSYERWMGYDTLNPPQPQPTH